jgi:hypothetical protein
MDNLELDRALRRLAGEPLCMPRAQQIEALLLERFERRRRPWLAIFALVGAACLAIAGFVRDFRPQARADAPFFAIPYTIGPAPYERTTVVRMEVPVSALVAAGFNVYAADTSATVQADVLFGQDDRAVAIRPLEPLISVQGE